MRVRYGARSALMILTVAASAVFGAGVATAATRSHPMVKLSKRDIARATSPDLPPTKTDGLQIQFGQGVSLNDATLWLDYVISVRQAALVDAKTEAQSLKHVSNSDEQQLLATLTLAGDALDTITADAPVSPGLSQIAKEGDEILGLQIYGVILPQYKLLQREDQLLSWTATLSNKEANAAAAIAIVELSTSVPGNELALDAAIQSIDQGVLAELNQSKSALLGVSTGAPNAASAVFDDAAAVISDAFAQLKFAESDLRQLVSLLAGGS